MSVYACHHAMYMCGYVCVFVRVYLYPNCTYMCICDCTKEFYVYTFKCIYTCNVCV